MAIPPPEQLNSPLVGLGKYGYGWAYQTTPNQYFQSYMLSFLSYYLYENIGCFFPEVLSKHPGIILDKSILAYNLWTRIFPDMVFVQENREPQSLSF